MLTQSVEFLRLGASAVSASLQLLLDTDGVPFTWERC